MNRSSARTFLAIFLVSAATLTYEIGLTRVFSISQGYHFAFMVISIALLGIGAGGAVMMVVGGRWPVVNGETDSQIRVFLATLAALFSIVSILSFIAANQIMFDPVKAAWSRPEFLKILAQYLILSLPFVVSGMILSSVYKYMSDMVHRTYLADMAGAGAGCILVLYIFSKSGGEGSVTVSAVLSLIASLLFLSSSHLKGKSLLIPVIAKIVLLLAVLSSSQFIEIRMSPYRELASVLNFPGSKVVGTMLSPSGRMDIVESPAVRAAPGISLKYQEPLPPQLGFTTNGGGLSTVTSRKGDLSFLSHLPSSLPYRLRRGGDVFVVDPGGGMEVLSALENGAREVSGSETRGIVLSAMKESLSSFSGGLYNELKIRHGYGRNVLKGSGRRFDIIQLPLTDTLGSSSSGIMGMQEEYNLTVEAFSDYIKHLKKDGFVSSSIYLLPPPRQELKLLATIAEALELTSPSPQSPPVKGGEATFIPSPLAGFMPGWVEGQGEGEFSSTKAAKRIIAIRSWGVLTILAKNGVVNASDIETVKNFCREERFDMVWYPGMKEDEANIYNKFPEPLYHRFFRMIFEGDKERFYRDYIFDVRPATDDRPFFGQTFKMTRMKETYEGVGRKWGILIEGGYLLPWILIQAVVASAILIMTPLLLSKRALRQAQGERGAGGKALLAITTYFSAIGVGFMFLEISIMQRMIPVLGEPVYAISAVLFTLLLSTGIGSYLSGRFRVTERYSIHVLLMVPVLAILYLFIMGTATEKVAGMTIIIRFVLTFLLFSPLGIVMGIPFPTGMSILGRKQPELIPWAWCINGSFSVISSVLAMMAALAWGFSTVHVLAAGFYFIAWLAVIPLKSSQPSAQRQPL